MLLRIICTSIKNIKICYDIAVYDHFPVSFSLSLNFCCNDRIINKKRTAISEYVNWKYFNAFDRKHYRDNIDKLFADGHLCSGYKCNLDHRAHLDSTYKYLINYFKDFTKEFTFHKQRRFTPIVGWIAFCKEKYECARQVFLLWVSNGRIRRGNLFDKTKCTKKAFVKCAVFL